MKYDFARLRKNGRTSGMKTIHLPRPTTIPSPNITLWWSSPIRPARACTWAIRAPTPRWISWPESAGCRAIMSCTRWAGTPSACPPRTLPLKTTSIRRSSQKITWHALNSSSRAWASPLTGTGKSTPPTRVTTSGPSGSSCSCSKRGWPIKRRCRSTGAPPARSFWPTRRSSTASASAAAARSSTR